MNVKMRYVYREVDRHGKVRHYFRASGRGKRIPIPDPSSPNFTKRYLELTSNPAAPMASLPAGGRPVRAKVGTFRALCILYYASPEFTGLAKGTQRVRKLILESCFAEPIAPGASDFFSEFPVDRMTPKAIRVLRDRKAEFPEAANGRVKAIRQVFKWAVAAEEADRNPAKDVPYIQTASEGFHSWTVEEVSAFRDHYPVGSKERLALALLLYTGQRRSDVVKFGPQHVKDGWLSFTQMKNKGRKPVTLSLPILPELQTAIDATPIGDLAFLVTEFGKPFTSNGFGNWMRKRCDQAGLPHCSAHGLRKAGASIAAENGATERQLMAIYGWSTMKEAARYTKAARQKVLAASGMKLLVHNEDRSAEILDFPEPQRSKSAG